MAQAASSKPVQSSSTASIRSYGISAKAYGEVIRQLNEMTLDTEPLSKEALGQIGEAVAGWFQSEQIG